MPKFPEQTSPEDAAEGRRRNGNGQLGDWVACVRPGQMMFESDGVSLDVAKGSLRLAAQKLPVRTSFVVRRDYTDAA